MVGAHARLRDIEVCESGILLAAQAIRKIRLEDTRVTVFGFVKDAEEWVVAFLPLGVAPAAEEFKEAFKQQALKIQA